VRVQVNDVRLFFDADGRKFVLAGDGTRTLPTVVLVPGGPGQSHLHHKVTPPIPTGAAHVLHYDHRGTGQSDASDPDHWNLETWASDLAALCDALELDRPIILGTSFGAIVALKFAQEYPGRLSKLILVSGVARFVRSDMLAVFERLGGTRARQVADAFYTDPSRDTAADFQRVCSPLYTRTPVDSEGVKAISTERFNMKLFTHWANGEAQTMDLRPKLSSVGCPTLVLAGKDDPAAPTEASREIAAGITRDLVTFRIFANCGHNPLHDARHEALAVVGDFIGDG
jgi:proline iminopeptidase